MADRSFLGDSGFDANNQKITNLATPTTDSDAATRGFARNATNINTGTLSAGAGGTGNITYAVGDILYASATTPTLSRLASAATGNALIAGGANTAPSWGKIGLTTHISGTLAAANGGTGFASYTIGDILYASTASALSTLAGVATGNVLISGGVGAAPSWGKVGLTTHVSGTLALGSGGTGATTQAGAANAILPSQTSQSGKYLTTDGTNVSWGTVGTTTNALTFNNAGSGAASGSTFNGSAAVTISHNTIGAPGRAAFPANNESTLDAADIRTLTNPTTGLGYAGGMRVRFSSLNDDNTTPFADVIELSTYTDSSGGGFNALYFRKDSQVIQHKYAAAAGTSWTAKTLAYTDSNITGTSENVTGTVAVANGGTGSTTQAGARTGLGATTVGANLFTLANPSAITFLRVNADNTVSTRSAGSFLLDLGATTVGSNLFTLTNPSAITFLRVNADNTVSALDAATFRTAIGAGTSSTSGTVTSVGGTGTVSGLTLTGTVTTSGNLTLGGTLSVTASNFASQTANTFLAAPNGSAGVPTFRAIVAGDIPTLNQSTTGSAATLTTTRTIWGQNFNGSANVTGALSGATTITVSSAINPSANDTVTLGASGNGFQSLQIQHAANRAVGIALVQTLTGAPSPRLFFNNSTDAPNGANVVFQSGADTLAFTTGGTVNTSSGTTRWSYNTTSIAPATTNAMSLGTASLVWSNVHATTFTGALSGNATTATTLQNARNINGVSFNGSADITVTAAAGTLTGTTLASGVTSSSLTSVGTLTALTVSGASPSFNTVDSTGTLTLGSSAGITKEQRFRLVNSVVTGGVELVLNGAGTDWGLYDRHVPKWTIRVTRGTPDTVDIAGNLSTGGTLTHTGATANLVSNATPTLNVGSTGTTTGATYIQINGSAGQTRGVAFRSGSSFRWSMYAASTAEAGSDAGSPLSVAAYTDAGAFIDNVLTITRASGGSIALARPVTMSGTLSVTGAVTTGVVSLQDSANQGRVGATSWHDATYRTANLYYAGSGDSHAAANWRYIRAAGVNNLAGGLLIMKGNGNEGGVQLSFFTTPTSTAADGTPASLTLRWRVDGSGAMTSGLINGQTISSSANFTGTVTATNFLLSSDARFKTNLVPLTDALDAVQRLNAYRYTHVRNEQQEVGVLAQELREVLPEAVSEDADGMLSVAYDRIVPLLLAAVKELSAQVKQLQAEA